MDLKLKLESTLFSDQLRILHLVADEASRSGLPLYIIGGSVRDLIFGAAIKDLDLIVEGDAIALARALVKRHGGKVTAHTKFRTAKWFLPQSLLMESSDALDLISARSETYKHPAALPTVKLGSLSDDIRRRDFTINTLAVRLDGPHFGQLRDDLNGMSDLKNGIIRALHKNSFMDDPTRMFRAIRYAVRYGFKIEPETQALFNAEAQTVLLQLSGERIRHEFDLIFEEADPARMLEELKVLGLLATLHPAFQIADSKRLAALPGEPVEGFGEFVIPEILSFRQTIGWIMYLASVPEEEINSLAGRLAFPVLLTQSVQAASSLLHRLSFFKDWKPSQWTFHLDELPSLAVYAVWLLSSEESLREYLTKWRNIKPFTNGNDLKTLGVRPGPKYKEILTRLRAAWLDEDVNSRVEEDILRSLLTKN